MPSPDGGPAERLLLRFAKGDPVRFVGHLDLMRAFERAMRRCGFPVAYSQGFNPRPRMAFASALTLGATSEWELCQLELAEPLPREKVARAVEMLREQLPTGLEISTFWVIPQERKNPYIQVTAAGYRLSFQGDPGPAAFEELLTNQSGQLGIGEWSLRQNGRPDEVVLEVILPAGERRGVRIRDLVAALEEQLPGAALRSLHRFRLWCEQEPAQV